MFARGTNAFTTIAFPLVSWPVTIPHRDVKSPMMLPVYSSGVTTSTFIIGSRSFAPAFFKPSLIAALDAIRMPTHLSLHHVALHLLRQTLKSITGNPANGPLSITD